jgi:hypothetical protein
MTKKEKAERALYHHTNEIQAKVIGELRDEVSHLQKELLNTWRHLETARRNRDRIKKQITVLK